MRKAMDIMRDMVTSKQYKMSIEIMELFSQYRAFTGYEMPKSKVIKALHITSHEYDYAIAGSTSIDLKIYEKLINYLKYECKVVDPKLNIMYTYTDTVNVGNNLNELPKQIVTSLRNIVSNLTTHKENKEISESQKTMSYKHAINL